MIIKIKKCKGCGVEFEYSTRLRNNYCKECSADRAYKFRLERMTQAELREQLERHRRFLALITDEIVWRVKNG